MGESNWSENLFQNVKGGWNCNEFVKIVQQEEVFRQVSCVSCIKVVFKGFWKNFYSFYEYDCTKYWNFIRAITEEDGPKKKKW